MFKDPRTLHLRIEAPDVRLRVRVRARDNLRNNHRSLRPLRHNNIDQLAQPRVRVFPAVSSTIVSASVQKDNIGLDARVGDSVGRAGDLVNDPARMALVVFVRHGAALHSTDIVDFGAGGGEGG
jgi:hypothetical protein